MSDGLEAGLWGLVTGGALVLGAAFGYFVTLSARAVAAVMAFGCGVLIAALCFELMETAYRQGGVAASSLGFGVGALVYSAANWVLNRRGAKHRKRSEQQAATDGGGAIAVGSLVDGIPESIAIGLTMLDGSGVSLVTVAAFFVSNVPEGLSSAAGMKRAGRSRAFIFGVWASIAVVSGLAAFAGYAAFANVSLGMRAALTAVSAGAILAMLVDTMVPEATQETHELSGLFASVGFLLAFALAMAED